MKRGGTRTKLSKEFGNGKLKDGRSTLRRRPQSIRRATNFSLTLRRARSERRLSTNTDCSSTGRRTQERRRQRNQNRDPRVSKSSPEPREFAFSGNWR